jgi:hypothetical protein
MYEKKSNKNLFETLDKLLIKVTEKLDLKMYVVTLKYTKIDLNL